MSVKNQMKRKIKKEKKLNGEADREILEKRLRRLNAELNFYQKINKQTTKAMLFLPEVNSDDEDLLLKQSQDDILPEKCSFCSKTFETENELDYHVTSHSAYVKTQFYLKNLQSLTK